MGAPTVLPSQAPVGGAVLPGAPLQARPQLKELSLGPDFIFQVHVFLIVGLSASVKQPLIQQLPSGCLLCVLGPRVLLSFTCLVCVAELWAPYTRARVLYLTAAPAGTWRGGATRCPLES